MHVQYQLHALGRKQITRDDVVGVVSFLNNASDDANRRRIWQENKKTALIKPSTRQEVCYLSA